MGQNWRQGEALCLNGTMAVCAMDQNVSAWKSTGRGCPTSQRNLSTAQTKTAALCTRRFL
jgi:hypothetical protein